MLGPSGSGKTTTLRMIAGFERPDEGVDRARRTRRLAAAAVRPAGQHGLPGLRAVPAHDRPAERRVRADGEEGREGRAAPAGAARRSTMVRLDGLRRAEAGAALGRAAAARRARAGDRQPAAGAAARRAARRARPQAPPGDADRAEADPAGGRDHLRLRHARPGGGADDERPDRGLQPRPDRAGRPARGGLRAPGERVHRRVRRRLERDRAGRPPVHGAAGEDPRPRRRRAAGRGRTWRRGRCATSSTSAR